MRSGILALSSLAFAAFAAYASGGYDVAAFVWPAYQPEPRWGELGIFRDDRGEWQSIYEAKPKFKGHKQPKVPLWGYENEADPVAVARKIDAALAAGVNVFIYDWYWYGGSFLQNGIDKGFLGAPNSDRMKFCLMWANHDVDNLWDNTKSVKRMDTPHMSAAVDLETFKKIADIWTDKYFKRPNYYKIDGKPVLSVFLPASFANQIGGVAKAREALDYLNASAKRVGFPGVHLQAIVSMYSPEPVKIGGESFTLAQFLKKLGFESATCYNWLALERFSDSYYSGERPNMDYGEWGDKSVARFGDLEKRCGLLFFPNVSCGWDTNPRFPDGSSKAVAVGQSPEKYENFLRAAKAWADKNIPSGFPKLITINSWNEWSEGSYLEPDEEFGYGFLNATARVFGPDARKEP